MHARSGAERGRNFGKDFRVGSMLSSPSETWHWQSLLLPLDYILMDSLWIFHLIFPNHFPQFGSAARWTRGIETRFDNLGWRLRFMGWFDLFIDERSSMCANVESFRLRLLAALECVTDQS
jgi:hypothetical protein